MAKCTTHPFLGDLPGSMCLLCEGERLADIDRQRRSDRGQAKKRQLSSKVDHVDDDTDDDDLNAPVSPSGGEMTWSSLMYDAPLTERDALRLTGSPSDYLKRLGRERHGG